MAGEIQLNSTTFATESGGTITVANVNSATNRTNLGLGSIATQASDSIDIDGGSIDGTTIGGTTPAAGTFTTFTSTGIDDNASSTAITIDSSGKVLLGTTTAIGERLTTKSSSGLGPVHAIQHWSSGASTYYMVRFYNSSGSTSGSITMNTSTLVIAFNTGSDYRLKTDVQPMTGATERLKALNPVNFAWKADGSRVDGFLAHEAQEVVPEAVTGEKDAVDADGNPEYQGIDQSKLVPLLTAALQESIALIESQQSQIDALTARIEALETA